MQNFTTFKMNDLFKRIHKNTIENNCTKILKYLYIEYSRYRLYSHSLFVGKTVVINNKCLFYTILDALFVIFYVPISNMCL